MSLKLVSLILALISTTGLTFLMFYSWSIGLISYLVIGLTLWLVGIYFVGKNNIKASVIVGWLPRLVLNFFKEKL